MRPAKFKFLFALLLSGVVASASAQSPSNLDFQISGSPYHDILDTGASSLLNYDLANDRIDFAVGSTGVYDRPLFCFDFSSEAEGVTLTATDANGHVVMDSIGLGSDLGYNLADNVISMKPTSSVQCFFKSSDGTFGPFGTEPVASRNSNPNLPPPCSEVAEGEDCRFLVDGFASYPELQLSYENFMVEGELVVDGQLVLGDTVSVSTGDELVYQIVLHNAGDAAAESIALQEVFPTSEDFSIGLSEGGWACLDHHESTTYCPTDENLSYLRFDGTNQISLPAGGTLTFTIVRNVLADSVGEIHLFAGAVNGSGASAESATARATLEIVGDAVGIQFLNQPDDTELGAAIKDANDNDIVVQIVDENGNHVSSYQSGGIRMELYQNQSWVADLTTRLAVTDGEVVFSNLTTDINGVVDGSDYHLYADHNDLNAVDESNIFEITPASAQ